MISMKKVSKSYEDVYALNNVSLSINKGSIYGLIGSNGAGKTTLLKIMSGVYKEDRGEVLVDEESVFENIDTKSKLIFIPDNPYFFPQYTIDDMAKFYMGVYESFSKDRYEKLKEVFNIETNKKISSLSKGMKRQVAFWLALSIMPEILVLDEPLDGLDPVMRQKVKNLVIQDVADREMTVVISSHNLRELEDMCDHIGILHKGSVIVEKDIDDLKSDVHKIQVAFKEDLPNDFHNNLNIVYKEERASVKVFVVKGYKDEIIKHFKKYNPLVLDILPLTLEEIFIYEMGDVGYEVKNIIF
jgi:ABC-2 type transport system ATP-binding protein